MSSVASGLTTSNGVNFSWNSKPRTISCRATNLKMSSMDKNLYKVLSLDSEKAGGEEIKKAYRRMALRYHPDVCSPSRREESTRMFVEISRAYQTLSNPVLRQRYDFELGLSEVERARRLGGFGKEMWDREPAL